MVVWCAVAVEWLMRAGGEPEVRNSYKVGCGVGGVGGVGLGNGMEACPMLAHHWG